MISTKFFFESFDSNRLFRQFSIFLVLFVLVLINYHFFLSNTFTPGGDGGRIYYYLKYLEKVPEIFPFWEAHKNYGYPLLADVDNHLPLALFLDTESPYFNAQLNLIFFTAAAIFAFIFRSIARVLGMSQLASLSVGVAVIVSAPLVRLFMHGTLVVLIDMILFYLAILFLMISVNKGKNKRIFLIILSSILLAWVVKLGYYLPVVFHIPALVLLLLAYNKSGVTIISAFKKSMMLLVVVSILMLLFSMPLLLPILDGVILSNMLFLETPTIEIRSYVHDYSLVLWPFIILALIFSNGIFRRFVYVLIAMASMNYLLLALDALHVESFFEAWRMTPILKNIRWQHPFRELASIAAVFCVGIFIDSIKDRLLLDKGAKFFIFTVMATMLLVLVVYVQYQKTNTEVMLLVSICFILLIIFSYVGNFKLALYICTVIAVLMMLNLSVNKSPLTHKLYTVENSLPFSEKTDYDYFWWRGIGYDRYTRFYQARNSSMVFMAEYRILLSSLYGRDITAQRPHWLFRSDVGNIQRSDRDVVNKEIAEVMNIRSPRERKHITHDLRVYDAWKVVTDSEAVAIMRREDFLADAPILLNEAPGFHDSADYQLEYRSSLTGKSADTISMSIETNKNSIILVPEIYHRDWRVTINGGDAKVLKAYASLRAVAVPPGRHEIRFEFIYLPFLFGLLVSFSTLLLAIAFLYVYRNDRTGEVAPQ